MNHFRLSGETGLFDTVGSFDMLGNADNSEFQLTLQPQDVGRAFQLCAHHEYRINFPLTSLKTKGQLPSNFFEETFPGAHTDVGGGYPFVGQYKKTDLPERYGIPTQTTYNRELVKVQPINYDHYQNNYRGAIADYPELERRRCQAEWQPECQAQYGQRGLVTIDDGILYFYRLQPINASLAGLTLERMKQQAELFGVEWNNDEYKLQFTEDYKGSLAQQKLWPALAKLPLGGITPDNWQADLPDHCIHRSHDTVINPGCGSFILNKVNDIANHEQFTRYHPDEPLKTPKREIYDNE